MSSVVALQQGWHWAGSVHATSGTSGGSGTSGQTQTPNGQTSHVSHGTATHGPAKIDPSQNGSLGQHVNTSA